MDERILRLMEGAYEQHTHAAPSILTCRDTILEIAREAKAYKMKGVVYKDIHFCTAPQASIVMEALPGINVIGGVSLFVTNGGLNPWAVEASFKVGGKVVWMFTLDSAFQISQFTRPGYPFPPQHNRNMLVDIESGGYTIFKEGTSELKEEARAIVSLCKEYDGVLETSHLSPEEALAIVREGKDQGLKKMVLTHANSQFTPYTVEQQKEFVRLGAVVNYCFEPYLPHGGKGAAPLSGLAETIREIGVENVVLGSDASAPIWPSAIECIRMFIAGLLANKFTEEEVAQMVKTNPDRLYT